MALKERLKADLKQAMKDGNKIQKNAITMIRARITNFEIDKKKEATEQEIFDLIFKEIKETNDPMADFVKAGRMDKIQEAEIKIKFLTQYVPKQMAEEAITILVNEKIAELAIHSRTEKGKLMKELMPLVKGKADGKLVDKVVTNLLAQL